MLLEGIKHFSWFSFLGWLECNSLLLFDSLCTPHSPDHEKDEKNNNFSLPERFFFGWRFYFRADVDDINSWALLVMEISACRSVRVSSSSDCSSRPWKRNENARKHRPRPADARRHCDDFVCECQWICRLHKQWKSDRMSRCELPHQGLHASRYKRRDGEAASGTRNCSEWQHQSG